MSEGTVETELRAVGGDGQLSTSEGQGDKSPQSESHSIPTSVSCNNP